jgi:hypothetical protein
VDHDFVSTFCRVAGKALLLLTVIDPGTHWSLTTTNK